MSGHQSRTAQSIDYTTDAILARLAAARWRTYMGESSLTELSRWRSRFCLFSERCANHFGLAPLLKATVHRFVVEI
jgi:hypothetical protein